MTRITDCPSCEAKDSLETFLRIDLDDVVVEGDEVVSFVLAGSANDPNNGLVTEEAHVSCRECGHTLPGVHVPVTFTNRWVYYDVSPAREKVQKLVHLLNRGAHPLEALASLGIEPEDVYTEDDSALSLDDPDNNIIDLGYDEHGVCAYAQRHGNRWHVHTVRRED